MHTIVHRRVQRCKTCYPTTYPTSCAVGKLAGRKRETTGNGKKKGAKPETQQNGRKLYTNFWSKARLSREKTNKNFSPFIASLFSNFRIEAFVWLYWLVCRARSLLFQTWSPFSLFVCSKSTIWVVRLYIRDRGWGNGMLLFISPRHACFLSLPLDCVFYDLHFSDFRGERT